MTDGLINTDFQVFCQDRYHSQSLRAWLGLDWVSSSELSLFCPIALMNSTQELSHGYKICIYLHSLMNLIH